jgi:hypothetical protein
MKRATHPGYAAICREAKELGWPRYFRRDLTHHDRQALAKQDPSEPFVWVVREETGTFLCFPRGYAKNTDLAYLLTILRTVERDFSGRMHWYWWDGRELWHSCAENIAERCRAEFEPPPEPEEFHGSDCKCDECAERMADGILAGMDNE